MASLRTKFTVGLFVIIGLALIVMTVLFLGLSEYFREGRKFVAFFDESVQGLTTDAPVKYRGVQVGKVDSMGVAPDGRLVRIVFSLNDTLENPQTLVAQVKAVGITGLMFIELERIPPGKEVARPKLSFTPEYPVIVTKPSEIQMLLTNLNAIMSQVKQLDIKSISDQMKQTLENMNAAIAAAQVGKISAGLQQTIRQSNAILDPEKWNSLYGDFEQTSRNLNRLIDQSEQTVLRAGSLLQRNTQPVSQSMRDIRAAAKNAAQLFEQGAALVRSSENRLGEYDQQLSLLLENLTTASDNLNRLLDQLRDQPSRLIFSPSVPPKKIEEE